MKLTDAEKYTIDTARKARLKGVEPNAADNND